jgi:hypothetical protein
MPRPVGLDRRFMAKFHGALRAAEPRARRNAITVHGRIDWRIDRHGDFLTLANALLFSTDWSRGAFAAAARHSALAFGAPKPRLLCAGPLRINPFPDLNAESRAHQRAAAHERRP